MADAPLLMPDDVVDVLFTPTGFRRGYDQDQVDAYLDRIVTTMRARIEGRAVPQPVSAADVVSVTFDMTRFRGGYDMVEVDEFLDRIHATLVALESGLRPS